MLRSERHALEPLPATALQLDPLEHGGEIIERCTKKGTQVVNVDGFKFIRKRKRAEVAPVQAAAVLQQACDPLATDSELVKGTDPIDQTPRPAAPPAEECQEPVERGQASVDEAKTQMDTEAAHADVEKQQPEQQQANGQPQGTNGEHQRPAREQNLKAVVAGLLSFIPSGCPAAVSVTWLLRETLHVAVLPGDEAASAAAAATLESFERGLDHQLVAAQQLLQGGPEQLQQFDRLPPIIRSMCAGERRTASLRQQLAALEQEEAAWLALEEKYRTGADCIGNGVDGAAPTATREDTVKHPVQQSVDVATLEDAHRRAELQLSLQIDAINNMLDKAEVMVTKAQDTCLGLQADYHKENFQSYAHVNSPQVLVKILSQAQPTAGMDFVPSSQPADN